MLIVVLLLLLQVVRVSVVRDLIHLNVGWAVVLVPLTVPLHRIADLGRGRRGRRQRRRCDCHVSGRVHDRLVRTAIHCGGHGGGGRDHASRSTV